MYRPIYMCNSDMYMGAKGSRIALANLALLLATNLHYYYSQLLQ